MEDWTGVVMAAGMGTRMRSKTPKIFHKLCGQELVVYPVEALKKAGINRVVVVVSPESVDGARALLGDRVEYVIQRVPLGTGDALLQAAASLDGESEHILAMGSDSPLIQATTLDAMCSLHISTSSHMTILSAQSGSTEGMGRVLRDEAGKVQDIVEAVDLEVDRSPTSEVNAGAYCLNAGWLWKLLPQLQKAQSGEVYLTSLVARAASQKARVEALVVEDPAEVLGINNRAQLATAEAAMRGRINHRWMLDGVTMIDPTSTYLDHSVELGPDTTIYPNTTILGPSKIGADCSLGPNTVIRDSEIGEQCRITASFVTGSIIEGSSEVGPFSHLRPGTHLESNVHIGSFGEIKNSRLGQRAAMGHFGYVGDASIGADVNLGAGMVTCNYDGVNKHRTTVADGAFIGCDTMFVAPVKVGEGAITGAGAVVTKDVPPYRLAVGVPATIKETKKARSNT